MANYMAEVANLLGVELGEEFEIKGYPSKYMFIKDGMIDSVSGFEYYSTFCELLTGKALIKRKPWKPQDNEKFYVVTSNWGVIHKFWDDCSTCKNYYKLGNLYKTEEEAEANRDKWIAFYASDEVLEV